VNETIRARLLKIKALADSGVEGERDNAIALLRRLAAENGVRVEDLVSSEREIRIFTVNSDREWTILSQVAVAVCQRNDVRGKRHGRRAGLVLTRVEAIDVGAAFTHYRTAWKHDEKDLFRAFVHKHNIFGPSSGNESKPMSKAELEKLVALIRGIRSQTWVKPHAEIEERRSA
jgi:hypothetical protein